MVYVKINDVLYPAEVNGKNADPDWDNRESKAITLEMDYATAMNTFVDGLVWSIVCTYPEIPTGDGNVIRKADEEFDNSEYFVAGSVTDHRDGRVTVKMGKPTDAEMLAELMEVLNEEA